jgi:archaellum component FlaC
LDEHVSLTDFKSYQTVDAAERAEKAESARVVSDALNNHADNLENLNKGYTTLFQKVQRLEMQMDALLTGVDQLTKELARLRDETHG